MNYRLNDERLFAVAELVRPGSVVADIGADHCRLVSYLVANGICPRGFACDIAQEPLESARATVQRLGLGDRISVLMTDGLLGLPISETDDIVIAGMGGELIAQIIGASPSAFDKRLRFILQPMTKAERLRRRLYRMGFCITEEHGVRENGFVYTVMAAEYREERREVDELFAWTGLLPKSNRPESRQMLFKIRSQLTEIAEGLDRSSKLASSSLHYKGILSELDSLLAEEML
ncbi:MAG: class I SAM-dependent methyltransferase [Oscillospiraceae bacterium]|nr:class I SAM-dependent methyltransferase [Oscillospiraceae bacterium]